MDKPTDGEKNNSTLDEEALRFHADGRPGKISISPTKPLATQHDLSLAYSPGVAAPCLAIQRDKLLAYDYTAKGNLVAVISNGTAVLGLGNLGALASKPVMEGKAVLFKRFADIDGIDLEVNTEDVDEFVNCVRFLGQSFGGINLEDIKAPECFIIEQRLREIMDIPVFHDDQHGTAIIVIAGLINALHLTGRSPADCRVVINGAGSAGIACAELIMVMGVAPKNVILCDTNGVIYQGRKAGMNQWKSAHAVDSKLRSLEQALAGADIFIGLSAKGAMTSDMVAAMADKPIIFALANPDPEITPEEIATVRDDAIVATGRSDYPNQVNNVLGFPYIFRGTLDVHASTINDAMKMAAAKAIAALAREDVPDEVAAAYAGTRLQYGSDYILPVPFDPRMISRIAPAVAKAAMESGVAQKPIVDMDSYARELNGRLDPTATSLHLVFERALAQPKRIVFAEGEEEKVIRAAAQWRANGYGTPLLVGRPGHIEATMKAIGLGDIAPFEVHNSELNDDTERYVELLYSRRQRRGALKRDCQRWVNQDRNVFAACMVACGDADGMVTGLTRSYWGSLEKVLRVLDPKPGHRLFGLSMLLAHDKTVLIADTTVNETPSPEELADIAIQSAAKARSLGHEPRIALLSYSTFGYPSASKTTRIREAVKLLDDRGVDFEYDGEMSADIALDADLQALFPFCRLSGPANVLVMPGLHAANIAAKLVQKLGGGTVIGPLLMGLEKPVQIVELGATVSDVLNLAAFAAADSDR
ncbi:MAG: NADP-dependent malic enzyme [Alphaproteobacteria bacterium]|jgi:malate dehydrogenase (oxaloacetate-decarboxylating)(NADP+)